MQPIRPAGAVYRIRNILTQDLYVGSTRKLQNRWQIHKKQLRVGSHCNVHLQRAWNKYGEDAFLFEIEDWIQVDDLLALEQAYLDFYWGRLYNIARIAKGGPLSVETKTKMSASRKGLKNALGTRRSSASRLKMSKSMAGNKNAAGHKMTEAHKKILSEARTRAAQLKKNFFSP